MVNLLEEHEDVEGMKNRFNDILNELLDTQYLSLPLSLSKTIIKTTR